MFIQVEDLSVAFDCEAFTVPLHDQVDEEAARRVVVGNSVPTFTECLRDFGFEL